MARLKSSPTTITVNSPAKTALEAAARAATANAFYPFTGNGLSTRLLHPGGPRGGYQCDVTEDGSQWDGHTAIDWAAKGVYDPQSKKVMWAGCGAGNNLAGGYVYNTQAIYDETNNQWSTVRGFKGANETTSATPIVHNYDGNAIDATGRRFYRKKLAREVMVYNLDTGAWLNNIQYSSGEPNNYGWNAGMDFIPSRNRLWIRSVRNGDDASTLFELDPGTGTITEILSGGAIGNDSQTSVCSFNPRAFGNAGGVFVGGTNAYTVRVDTLAVQDNSAGKPSASGSFSWNNSPAARNQHLCRDPVGDGWLYASTDGYMYRLTSNGTWMKRALLPAELRNGSNFDWMMVPIDTYGVVWFITKQGVGPERAWLYKP